MGAYALRSAARTISWRSEAQHAGEVLGELFQSGNVTYMNAVLKIRSHSNQGNIFLVAWFPCQQLKKKQKKTGQM